MIAFSVVMIDPSLLKGGDYFAIVGARLTIGEDTIKYKLAKQMNRGTFEDAARYLKRIHNTIHPNFMGMETNGDGADILKLFKRKYHLNFIKGVSTSGTLTEKTRQMGHAMDKPFMVKWFAKRMREHKILFPAVPSKGMQEYIDQIPKIVAITTAGGQTSYKAYRGQHDDLFIAGLHCANIIRLFLEQQERLK